MYYSSILRQMYYFLLSDGCFLPLSFNNTKKKVFPMYLFQCPRENSDFFFSLRFFLLSPAIHCFLLFFLFFLPRFPARCFLFLLFYYPHHGRRGGYGIKGVRESVYILLFTIYTRTRGKVAEGPRLTTSSHFIHILTQRLHSSLTSPHTHTNTHTQPHSLIHLFHSFHLPPTRAFN